MKITEENLKQNILDVAEELFAEKGFTGTSIREITKRAKCNIASVNYHFHGKENLYIEIFRRNMNNLREQRINSLDQFLSKKKEETTLEGLIQIFAEAFMDPFFTKSSGRRLMALMMSERKDPHLPRYMFVEEIVQPVKKAMKDALKQTIPELSETVADLCIHSIVGQLVHVLQAQELFEGMSEKAVPVLDLPKAIKHVVRFSVGGVLECTH